MWGTAEAVNLCSQNEIALREPVNLVGPNRNIDLSPR